jgi:L-rhamnose mutarotase
MAIYIGSDGKKHRYPGTTFHKEKGAKNYLIHFHQDEMVYASLSDHDNADHVPPMCHGNASQEWISKATTVTSFAKLPKPWQNHFREYIETEY